MSREEDDVMNLLDARLRKAMAGLDAAEGFEDRLRSRLSALAEARTAPDRAALRAALQREHDRQRAAAGRAALMDGAAIAVAGAGGLAAAWSFAPELVRLYATAAQAAGPTAVGFATVALAGAALWALLRRFDVNLAAMAGGGRWNASTS